MFYFQAELIAKQRQQEIELKAKDAWKFHKGYEVRNVDSRRIIEPRTPNVHSSGSCCTA